MSFKSWSVTFEMTFSFTRATLRDAVCLTFCGQTLNLELIKNLVQLVTLTENLSIEKSSCCVKSSKIISLDIMITPSLSKLTNTKSENINTTLF